MEDCVKIFGIEPIQSRGGGHEREISNAGR
jgi:hypothetical protein